MQFHTVTILLEKCFADAELLIIFVKSLIWLFLLQRSIGCMLAFSILGCPYFGGYYSGLLKVYDKLFIGFGT
jgi:hypothetical protein